MFKFLKLHSSSSGDARRHVPFESIIHKHIFPILFTSVLFLTLVFRPYSAEAAAQLIPQIEPVYDTTITNLYEFVKVQLDDTHKQVFDLFLGSYMLGYGGMADYELSYVYNSETPVKEWLINSGADLYNSILSLGGISSEGMTDLNGVPKIGYQQLSPLIQVAMGTAIKSKDYASVDDALTAIHSADYFPIPLNVDIMSSLNAAMGFYGGLYVWQYQPLQYTSNWTWNNYTISGTLLAQYNEAVNNLATPRHPASNSQSNIWRKNCITGSNPNGDIFDLFINTSNNTAYFYNAIGTSSLPSVNVGYGNSISKPNGTLSFHSISFNPNNFDSYFDVAEYALNYRSDYYSLASFSADGISFDVDPMSFFSGKVYYGSSWSNKQEVNAVSGKNLEVPNQPTFLQGVENGLLDLKGLLEDIIGELELRPPVINNYYYPDGDPVPEADIEPAMQNNTVPDSGVDVDPNIFLPLFESDGKKSYISYLWYMTKPLILYTKDLFDCLVFEPVADFAGSGPGYFVYGVIGLGLISGLLVKCLL